MCSEKILNDKSAYYWWTTICKGGGNLKKINGCYRLVFAVDFIAIKSIEMLLNEIGRKRMLIA